MSEHKFQRGSLSVESGSSVVGDFMVVNAPGNGIALSVDGSSTVRAQHATFGGAVTITNGSVADLTGSLVERGLPNELVDDARRLAEAGDKPGALRMLAKWTKANLRPTEIAATLAIAQQMLGLFR